MARLETHINRKDGDFAERILNLLVQQGLALPVGGEPRAGAYHGADRQSKGTVGAVKVRRQIVAKSNSTAWAKVAYEAVVIALVFNLKHQYSPGPTIAARSVN